MNSVLDRSFVVLDDVLQQVEPVGGPVAAGEHFGDFCLLDGLLKLEREFPLLVEQVNLRPLNLLFFSAGGVCLALGLQFGVFLFF